jgi:hypothetical protein
MGPAGYKTVHHAPDHYRQSNDPAQLTSILAGKWVCTAIVAIVPPGTW